MIEMYIILEDVKNDKPTQIQGYFLSFKFQKYNA